MSHHRKVYSQGNIPFAWEDKPGISKAAGLQIRPTNPKGFRAQTLDEHRTSPSFSSHKRSPSSEDSSSVTTKIPPPPSRSNSAKGLKWKDQEDPFLLALKECTKPVKSGKSPPSKMKKRVRFNISFSCKSSSACDVRNDNDLVAVAFDDDPAPRDLGNKLENLMMVNW